MYKSFLVSSLFKKGLLEDVFRADYPEISLKKILKERKLYSEKGLEYPHVTLSKDGIYDKGERYNRDFLVKSEEKQYKITKLNDLCYNPANLAYIRVSLRAISRCELCYLTTDFSVSSCGYYEIANVM